MTTATSPPPAPGTIRCRSGEFFSFLDPTPAMIHPDDLAHALANVCRFAGHLPFFYSVAQHSVLLVRALPDEMRRHQLQALFHDAAEAYLGDVPRPLKQLLPDYQALEARVWAVLAERFGLPAELSPIVKTLDDRLLKTEARDLIFDGEDPPPGWYSDLPCLPFRVEPWDRDYARREFLRVGARLFPESVVTWTPEGR